MHNVVIKENEIVFVCDQSGDVSPQAEGGLGLYFRDTRFLSELGLEVNGARPLLLSSSGEQTFLSNLQCANPDWVLPDGTSIPPQTISIRRDRLVEGGLHERIGLFNYTQRSVPIEIRLSFRADFRDIFDIRQFGGEVKRGHFQTPELSDSGLDLSYLGLDRVRRRTEIRFEPAPDELIPSVAVAPGVGLSPAESYLTSSVSGDEDRGPGGIAIFRVLLQSQESSTITFRVIPVVGDEQPYIASFETVAHTVQSSYQRWEADSTLIETSNSTFNRLLRRSQLDLRALLVRRETGLYPDAGIPWFAVPFGRDGLITAYQALLLSPEIAVGTLRYLAHHQGQRVDPWRDEQPGKILHEMRFG
ncbi:MAG: hypothetical protein HY329_22355, partial [Chloroflexi bacterium]|nr:hypothetical protein [Chloroflexota bacterium]